MAAQSVKLQQTSEKSGITVDEINSVYKNKYPYPNVYSLFTKPEHHLFCAKILEDNADEGIYLPKEEKSWKYTDYSA